LHGTGGDEHQLVELGRRLAPRASLLSPRGTVLEGGVARRFFRRHSLTELDLDDLRERTDELGCRDVSLSRREVVMVARGCHSSFSLSIEEVPR
jgi:predicted esterase